jgi:hypothetical protein
MASGHGLLGANLALYVLFDFLARCSTRLLGVPFHDRGGF